MPTIEPSGDFQHYEDDAGTHIVVKPTYGGRLHLLIIRQETRRVGGGFRRAWFVIDGDVEPHPNEAWFSWHYGYDRALERATRRAIRHLKNYSVDRRVHGRS